MCIGTRMHESGSGTETSAAAFAASNAASLSFSSSACCIIFDCFLAKSALEARFLICAAADSDVRGMRAAACSLAKSTIW